MAMKKAAAKAAGTRKYSPSVSKNVETEMQEMKAGHAEERRQRQDRDRPEAGDRDRSVRGAQGGQEGPAESPQENVEARSVTGSGGPSRTQASDERADRSPGWLR